LSSDGLKFSLLGISGTYERHLFMTVYERNAFFTSILLLLEPQKYDYLIPKILPALLLLSNVCGVKHVFSSRVEAPRNAHLQAFQFFKKISHS
jgi:hypothetical protein